MVFVNGKKVVFRKAPRRPRRMGKKPLVKLMKQVATKVQNAGLETKYVSETINNIQFNSGITTPSDVYSLIPQCASGTDVCQRIGLDVTPLRVTNTWVVSLNTVSRSVNIYVDLFLLIDKRNRYYPQVAAIAPRFLRTGNTSAVTQFYNGFNTDGFQAINQERYTLLKHFRFQLANNVGVPNGDTTSGNAPNITGQSAKTISYTVDTPKQYRYQPDATVTYPNGHAPFWVMGYSKVDGSSPDVANQSINVSHITRMWYKDA